MRELWVQGDLYRRRIDIVGFVNGIPLLFVECKNIHKDLKTPTRKTFLITKIPSRIFFITMRLSCWLMETRQRSVLSPADLIIFMNGNDCPNLIRGVVSMETLLKGVCNKHNFIDISENFIVFDDSTGKQIKILAKNHQYLGVNQVITALTDPQRQKGKFGVFWHTQSSGKSYSMVFFTSKVHRKIGGNYTF